MSRNKLQTSMTGQKTNYLLEEQAVSLRDRKVIGFLRRADWFLSMVNIWTDHQRRNISFGDHVRREEPTEQRDLVQGRQSTAFTHI
jgi:hypothetical protein